MKCSTMKALFTGIITEKADNGQVHDEEKYEDGLTYMAHGENDRTPRRKMYWSV